METFFFPPKNLAVLEAVFLPMLASLADGDDSRAEHDLRTITSVWRTILSLPSQMNFNTAAHSRVCAFGKNKSFLKSPYMLELVILNLLDKE